MEKLLNLTKRDRLESGGVGIIGKYSMNEVETGAVITVGKIYTYKEP